MFAYNDEDNITNYEIDDEYFKIMYQDMFSSSINSTNSGSSGVVSYYFDNKSVNPIKEDPDAKIITKYNKKEFKKVKECAAELNINLVYLPPYSPNLNLIERLWKFMRSKVLANKYYNSFKCFFDKVHDFLSSAYIEYSSSLNSLLALNFQCFDSNCCIN